MEQKKINIAEQDQNLVTEQLFRALRESKEMTDALDVHSIVSITDALGNIIYVNDQFVEISGYNADELLGNNHRLIKSHVQPDEFWGNMWKTVTSGKPWRDVVCNLHKNGSLYWVDTQISPLFNEAGVIDRYISIRSDITKLVRATEAAREASKIKSQFLANMSHEIRTPMNAILGLLTLMRNTELTAQQLDYTNKTEGAAKSLLALINDILDFSKMDAHKMLLDLQPFRMDHFVRDLSVIVLANVGPKPVTVKFEVDPAMPKALVGDVMRLQQVLLNLCSNAIKFTHQGDVCVEIKVQTQSGGSATLHFVVRDSGIGIAPEHQQHIFAGFSQAEASTTRKFGGTGLGLAISKQLVELMGGELALDSVLGQGSSFYFTIMLPVVQPVADVPALPVPTPASAEKKDALDGLRLLVVEDNLINQMVARELLSARGALVEIAANGQLGVDAVAAANPPFDAVLMDLQMPVMDGYAATHAIRTVLGMTALPIIAVTANAMASDRADCLAAGMNEHVSKPFNLPHLIQLLQRITGRSANECIAPVVS